MVDEEVLDIQVVWNSKSNGHNATVWAPGFMLDDIGDVKKMVVRWLASCPSGHLFEHWITSPRLLPISRHFYEV